MCQHNLPCSIVLPTACFPEGPSPHFTFCSFWRRRPRLEAVLMGSILQYFRPSISYLLSERSLFCLFLSGCLRQVLLYHLFWPKHNCAFSRRDEDNRAVSSIQKLFLKLNKLLTLCMLAFFHNFLSSSHFLQT